MTWANLTQKQRRHLIFACSQGLNPKDKSLDHGTIESLETAGLIHRVVNSKGRALWRPTDTGRGLVASRGLIPTFLHRRSQYGYTNSYHQAMCGEPEVMDDAA
jgi:hypothetical protein